MPSHDDASGVYEKRPELTAGVAFVRTMRLISCTSILLLTSIPAWLYGGTGASAQVWTSWAAILGLASCLLLVAIDKSVKAPFSWTFVLLLLGLALGLFQLVPSSQEIRTHFQEASRQLVDEANCHRSEGVPAGPVSVYSAATRRDIASLSVAVATFLVASVCLQFPWARSCIFICVALNGTLLSVFGIVQRLTYNGHLYWLTSLADGGQPFASFVNRNNAGGYLNLCIAGALALTVRQRPERINQQTTLVGTSNAVSMWGKKLVFLAFGVIGCGVICTLSRGALFALATSAILTWLAQKQRRISPGMVVLVGCVGVASVSVLLLVGDFGLFAGRFADIFDLSRLASERRIQHWWDVLSSLPDYWRVGAGLGNYRYAYMPYQDGYLDGWFYHAENQYLEALVVGGLPGLLMMLAAIACVSGVALRMIRGFGPIECRALGAALLFAITGQALHALFDFGLYVPANTLLLATICGLIKTAEPTRNDSASESAITDRVRRITMSAACLILICGLVMARREFVAISHIENAVNKTRLDSRPNLADPSNVHRAVVAVQRALDWRPDDASGHYRLGQLYVQLYRIHAARKLGRLKQSPEFSLSLWNATSITKLQCRAHELIRSNNLSQLEELLSQVEVQKYLSPANTHFLLARDLLPLHPYVHLRLAELAFLSGQPADDQQHLTTLRRIAKHDPYLRFRSGVLEYQAGRLGTAFADWKASLGLSPQYFDDIATIVSSQSGAREMIRNVIPDSPALLVRLASSYFVEQTDECRLICFRAEQLLEGQDDDGGNVPRLRGSIHVLQSRYKEAAAEYERALMWQPDNTKLRYEFAQVLAKLGREAEARRNAALCVRLKPGNRMYQRLLDSIPVSKTELNSRHRSEANLAAESKS